jgi:prepilin-type N-terminal cleavage/methylation domain-containing protein
MPESQAMRDPRAGFTLIELLVVIGIIALLAAAFLPDILGAQSSADQAADRANLSWHYTQITRYKTDYGKLPRGTGHKFVIDPWVRRKVEHTEANFRRYWTPGLEDPRRDALEAQGLDSIWKTQDELTSEDTHYAGPGPDTRRQRLSGRIAIMANDNEFGPAFNDFAINVLLGDGALKTLQLDPDLLELDFDPDAEGANFPVGPESDHPLLKGLEK